MNRPTIRKRRDDEQPRPDIEGAKAQLDRARAQRADVQRVIDDLVQEEFLNHFTANVVFSIRGGRT